MRRKTLLGVATAIAILLSACQTQIMDHRWDEIISPVVQVFWGSEWMGSGTVIGVYQEDDTCYAYVLTAAHVVNSDGMGTPPTNLAVGVSWGESWIAPAEVVSADFALDLALLKTPYEARYVALVRLSPVPLDVFTPSYAVGVSAFDVPIANIGEVTWVDDAHKFVYSSSHINYGYSGGGLYVEEDGHWVLVGVTSFCGAGPLPYFHAAGFIDIRAALTWFTTIGFEFP